MRTLTRLILVFVGLSFVVFAVRETTGVEFGRADYWDIHGFGLLIFATVLPRIALLLGGVIWGGWLAWLAWLFAPRLLIAVLATLSYWHQNPLLVVCAWLIALGGESSEKVVVYRRLNPRNKHKGFESAKWV